MNNYDFNLTELKGQELDLFDECINLLKKGNFFCNPYFFKILEHSHINKKTISKAFKEEFYNLKKIYYEYCDICIGEDMKKLKVDSL